MWGMYKESLGGRMRTNCNVAITFMAQWHPLIEPKMSKLRPGYLGGS